MQRYTAPSCTSAVRDTTIGGASVRDTSSLPNISLNSRRNSSQLTSYKLRCDKEPLNSRLGPPDFHPQTSDCPEETLTREYVQGGYKEIVEGIEEAREIALTQIQAFPKPVFLKWKEAIRKRLRAINESRAQKRKAGQVYGVPLSGTQLSKPGVFPEQKPCSEDLRKKWIEGLSQPHKRLRSLADHVPHGYRKKSLFEVLIKNNVPLLRATWFVKVTYLNQVRPGSASIGASILSGASDKAQFSRTELWTKDVIEYLQGIIDEIFSKNNSHSALHTRDRSPQVPYTGSIHHRSDLASAVFDAGEPSLHFKWWYMVQMLQWHHAEGLLLSSYIIDWVLNQLQDKELLEILQLLLPIIYGFIETLILSQTYVRMLVEVALGFIRKPPPGGSDLVDNSRRAYTASALVELLRYLIMAVPDTFVALDCFPLPSYVGSYMANDGNFFSKVSEDAVKTGKGALEVASVFRERGLDAQHLSSSFSCIVSSIQKRADNLAKASSPGYPGHNMAKAIQALDNTLVLGDLKGAYKCLFEELCTGAVDETWITEVSPLLRSSLKWIDRVSLSFICSVFFLCEWATSDFRDFRTAPPHQLKLTGGKDYSQIYIAIRILKLKIKDLQNSLQCKADVGFWDSELAKGLSQPKSQMPVGIVHEYYNSSNTVDSKHMNLFDLLESPGPLHDIIVCWIDQHDMNKGDGLKRLQLLIMELTRCGIFYPQAYARQLIVSGIMDRDDPQVEQDRRKKHYRVLKQLPEPYVREALEEGGIAEVSLVFEAMQVYANERRLVLRGLGHNRYKHPTSAEILSHKQKHLQRYGRSSASPTSVDQQKGLQLPSNFSAKSWKNGADIEELKSAISIFLQLPSSALSTVSGVDESKGSVRRYSGANYNKMDVSEGTPGCEECKRVKRQKISEEKSLSLQGDSPNLSDDEDSWWVKKGSKPFECAKVDPPLKPAKQASRGRQKIVRKTQSLAQLAATRIESSQGASTSHICDSRISCPHHRSALDGDISKSVEGVELTYSGNIASIGKVLKQLHFAEKRSISRWLISLVRELVEEAEKATPKIGQFNRSFSPPEERSFLRWKLGEDELSTILYLMDVSSDVVSAARFLLWLLPKVLGSPSTPIHGGRNMMTLSRTVESHVCEVGEAFLLSSIRRYENVLVATDLIPEALSATMYRAAALMASSGRVSSSSVVVYAKYLLKKYGTVPSVIDWEKNFKATCDKRFLSELETGRLQDVEVGYPLGVPTGVEDLDEYLRQKIGSGRLSRVALSMRDIVQRHVEDAFSYYLGKERKLYVAGAQKGATVDKWDDGHQIAKQIIMGLIECIRQTGGAAQEGDPSLVSSAVSAIVSNVGPSLSKVPDFPSGSICSSSPSSGGSLSFARRILHLHVACLCLLKEALGERHGRAFEIALATEATSALAGVFAPVKASRNQFQPSPEAHDSSANMSNDVLNNSAKVNLGRPAKIAAAVSALVVAAVIHGVSSLERMVTVFKLKEGLDVIHFMRSTRCNSNGNARSLGALKMDNPIEVYVHLFRLLVGNCRSVSDGLVVELVGEPSIVALMRMQRTLPLNLVFPPAYSIFAFVIWKTFIINNSSVAASEDMQQLYQSFTSAISDTIRHLPFRDICMGNTHGFYELVASDATESEFAAMLPHNGSDMHMKVMGFVPLRARLFLNCLIDCKMPNFIFQQDDFTLVTGIAESKVQYLENQANLLNKLVHVLDTLQPAKFHWQWVELRLLLNEQALIEKLETHDVSLVDALRSLSPTLEKASPSDNENNFIVIILTRLLVRPDAAPLFSEVVHRFGRSLEDSMLLQAKWFLGGNDVLLGRKSIRQRLINIAESKGFSTKAQLSKPWGWSKPSFTILTNKGDKKKFETTSLEEGEVVEETVDLKKGGKWSTQKADAEVIFSQQHLTERAFVELILPCIDQSSDESRKTFANDLIKQMSTIEQLINGGNRGTAKQAGTVTSGIEGPGNKVSNRKAIRSGSPGLARRQTGAADSVPLPSPAALRASIALRLQLLLRLLPIICADGEREPSGRNMRHVLASVILRLLGSRVVHENVDLPFSTDHGFSSPTEVQLRASAAASIDLSGEILFDRLLLVLHGLLSGCQPSWLKMRFPYKSVNESARNFPGFDRDVAENLQNDLDRMQLPDMIRWRIQTAMPVLLSPVRCSISCQPPSVSTAALVSLQSSISVPGVQIGNPSPVHRNTYSSGRPSNLPGKPKVISSQQDHDMEVDPWMLLEDGAGCGPTSSNTAAIGSSDHANLRASSWLKGTIRVRRTDLTYIGVIDDDS